PPGLWGVRARSRGGPCPRNGPARPGLRHGRLAAHAGRLLWRGGLSHQPRARALLSQAHRLGLHRRNGAHGTHRGRRRPHALRGGRGGRPRAHLLRGGHRGLSPCGALAVREGMEGRVDAGSARPHSRGCRGRPGGGGRHSSVPLPRSQGGGGVLRFQRGQRHRPGHARHQHGGEPRRQAPALERAHAEGARVNIEQGLKLSPEEIGRAEALRTTLWHRVRTFMATRDLLILPTVAVPPFPVETPYPTEINCKPLENYTQWFFLTYGITLTGLPAIS